MSLAVDKCFLLKRKLRILNVETHFPECFRGLKTVLMKIFQSLYFDTVLMLGSSTGYANLP